MSGLVVTDKDGDSLDFTTDTDPTDYPVYVYAEDTTVGLETAQCREVAEFLTAAADAWDAVNPADRFYRVGGACGEIYDRDRHYGDGADLFVGLGQLITDDMLRWLNDGHRAAVS